MGRLVGSPQPQTWSRFDGKHAHLSSSHFLETLANCLRFHFVTAPACVLIPFQVQYRTMSNMYAHSVRFSLKAAFRLDRP
jgi:hypothetical protein